MNTNERIIMILITGFILSTSLPTTAQEKNSPSASETTEAQSQQMANEKDAPEPAKKETIPDSQAAEQTPEKNDPPESKTTDESRAGNIIKIKPPEVKVQPPEVTVEDVYVVDPDPLRAKTLAGPFSFNREYVRVSGYFAPMVRMGELNGDFAVFGGFKGGMMINDFSWGAAAFIYTDYIKRVINTHNHKVYTGYAGLFLEYNFFRREVVNFSVGTIVGAGTSGYFYEKKVIDDDDCDDDEKDYNYEYRYKGTCYFVLEPEIIVYINVARFFRIGFGASYRYTEGLNKYGLTDKTFDGFNGLVMFQFGWF